MPGLLAIANDMKLGSDGLSHAQDSWSPIEATRYAGRLCGSRPSCSARMQTRSAQRTRKSAAMSSAPPTPSFACRKDLGVDSCGLDHERPANCRKHLRRPRLERVIEVVDRDTRAC